MKTSVRSNVRFIGCVTLLAVALAAGGEAGETWPSFQNGGHVSLGDAAAADGSVLREDVAWTASLPGYGQSSPVAWNGQVYVTSVTGENKDTYFVSAFKVGDGAKLWEHSLANATPQESSNYVSKAAPTPAVDDLGVICFFEGGNVVALTHGGDIRWERNLVEDYGAIEARHGLSASVEQDASRAYVWVERSENPYILALDKASGEAVWKSDGPGATSWASPRLVPVEDGQHLVLSAVGSLTGLNPETGEQFWRFEGISGNSTPTPVPLGDGRFLVGATVGRGESTGGAAAESNGVVAITRSADGPWQAQYVWQAERATSSFGSPIAHLGMAYFVNRTGVLYGLDVATGEERFAERLTGSNWATPIGLGNRVFFFDKDGRISVLSADAVAHDISVWESLPKEAALESGEAEASADGPPTGSVLYAAAWCNDRLLLRRGDRLYAVGLTGASGD